MVRPFKSEVEELEDTYLWARTASVESLARRIALISGRPLFAVGSGGSLTTASIAADLFRDLELGFSTAITPLELACGSRISPRPKIDAPATQLDEAAPIAAAKGGDPG